MDRGPPVVHGVPGKAVPMRTCGGGRRFRDLTSRRRRRPISSAAVHRVETWPGKRPVSVMTGAPVMTRTGALGRPPSFAKVAEVVMLGSDTLLEQERGARVRLSPSLPLRAGGAASTWWRPYACVLALIDSAAVILGSFAAQWVWFGNFDATLTGGPVLSYVGVAFATAPAWVLTLTLGGAYDRRYFGWGTEEYRRVFDSAVRFLLVVSLVGFLLRIDVARGFVAVAIPLATTLTLFGRYGLRRWLHRMRRTGRFTKKVLVVGSALSVGDLVRQLHSGESGLTVIGACMPEPVVTIDVDGEFVPVLGNPEFALEAIVSSQADVVAIADAHSVHNGALRQLAWQLEGTGVDLMVAPALTDVTGPHITIRAMSNIPLLLVEEPELKGRKRLAKGAFDRLIAGVGLVTLLPLLLVIGVVVRLTSRGPALFRQVRVGLGGRHFMIWKFRTMSIDAEARLHDVQHLNEHDGVLFKIRDDPRVTRAGRFLRRWSLDELPQLWNVMRGDMSLVGPRPPLPCEVERYDHHVRRRLLVKPGITGLWQVGGRSGLPWDEAVRLDLYYVENWSLSMDATVIAKTLTAVLRCRGAC